MPADQPQLLALSVCQLGDLTENSQSTLCPHLLLILLVFLLPPAESSFPVCQLCLTARCNVLRQRAGGHLTSRTGNLTSHHCAHITPKCSLFPPPPSHHELTSLSLLFLNHFPSTPKLSHLFLPAYFFFFCSLTSFSISFFHVSFSQSECILFSLVAPVTGIPHYSGECDKSTKTCNPSLCCVSASSCLCHSAFHIQTHAHMTMIKVRIDFNFLSSPSLLVLMSEASFACMLINTNVGVRREACKMLTPWRVLISRIKLTPILFSALSIHCNFLLLINTGETATYCFNG